MEIRPHEIEVLDALCGYCGGGEWARPMDIGGRDGSHHSRALARLERAGLVVSRQRGALMQTRGSKVYQPTSDGLSFIRDWRALGAAA